MLWSPPMALPPRASLIAAALAWVGALLAAVLALERPAPLFVNLGAGGRSELRLPPPASSSCGSDRRPCS